MRRTGRGWDHNTSALDSRSEVVFHGFRRDVSREMTDVGENDCGAMLAGLVRRERGNASVPSDTLPTGPSFFQTT